MALPEAVETYLDADDLKDMSEFPRVKRASDTMVLVALNRAHAKLGSFGSFPALESLDDDAELDSGLTLRETFANDMQLAVFLIAERMILANPITPMDAAGISMESAGNSRMSRAGEGGRGKAAVSNLVPIEAIELLQRWVAGAGSDLFRPERQNLFQPPLAVNTADVNEKVFVLEDTEDLAPSLGNPRSVRG